MFLENSSTITYLLWWKHWYEKYLAWAANTHQHSTRNSMELSYFAAPVYNTVYLLSCRHTSVFPWRTSPAPPSGCSFLHLSEQGGEGKHFNLTPLKKSQRGTDDGGFSWLFHTLRSDDSIVSNVLKLSTIICWNCLHELIFFTLNSLFLYSFSVSRKIRCVILTILGDRTVDTEWI